MPIVRVYCGAGVDAGRLRIACAAVIPAALATHEHPLRPDGIRFMQVVPEGSYDCKTDALIDVECDFDDERAAAPDNLAQEIREALVELLPEWSYAVWVKVSRAGFASAAHAQADEPVAHLPMTEAIDRARRQLSSPTANASDRD